MYFGILKIIVTSAPNSDPTGGAYSAPQTSNWFTGALFLRGRGGREGTGGEGRERREKEEKREGMPPKANSWICP